MNKIWEVRLTLSNGETRHLANAGGPVDRATESLEAFITRQAPFDGEFVETVDATAVARAHVVEADVVPI